MAGCQRWSRQRHGDDAFGHFRAQRRDARGPRLIAPKPRSTFVSKPFLRAPDHRLGLASRLHDRGRAATIGRQKNDFRSPNFCGLLRLATTASSLLRSVALNRIFVRSCMPQTRTRESGRGIPKRIEMLDLVH